MRSFARFLALCAMPLLAAGPNTYIQHNLVADTPGIADVTDPNLVNPWGLTETATSPFWLSDSGTGLATIYSTSATTTITVSSTKVTIPTGATDTGKIGPVTGQVANTSTAFLNGTTKASFIFSSADGVVAAWNGGAAAAIKIDNSAKGAIYYGLALGGTSSAPQLYVPNFHSGAIEVYDGNFAPVSLPAAAFTDPSIPAGYAPFNIQVLNGNLYVAYAKQNASASFDVAGAGLGFVDIFDMSGNLKKSLIAGGSLNAPWGLAIAPANFGAFSNMLLVGNFGDGRINVYDPAAGTPMGALLNASNGSAIAIDGLWALQVGNGKSGGDANAVYFTAGPGGEKHGLLGSLQAAPVLGATTPVVNGASFLGGIAEYTWVSIFGSNLSSTTRTWQTSDIQNGNLPTQLDGVSVRIDGRPAYISYISPVQINALMPADFTLGPVQVQTINQILASSTGAATLQATAPAFFISKSNYVAALHANNTIVGPSTLFPNNSTPAAPGETIELYGTGFGPATTAIPNGQVIANPIPITGVTVMIGGAPATVTAAALVGPGLYQINVTIPASTPNGDAAVSAAIGGQVTQTGALVSVHN